jgi:hypothetical protein
MEMEPDVQLSNAIKSALTDLEKAETLLTHWTNEYVFKEMPNPKVIFNDRIPPSDLQKMQSAKWFNEYRFISRFVQMAQDYVMHAKQELEKAMQAQATPYSMGDDEPHL